MNLFLAMFLYVGTVSLFLVKGIRKVVKEVLNEINLPMPQLGMALPGASKVKSLEDSKPHATDPTKNENKESKENQLAQDRIPMFNNFGNLGVQNANDIENRNVKGKNITQKSDRLENDIKGDIENLSVERGNITFNGEISKLTIKNGENNMNFNGTNIRKLKPSDGSSIHTENLKITGVVNGGILANRYTRKGGIKSKITKEAKEIVTKPILSATELAKRGLGGVTRRAKDGIVTITRPVLEMGANKVYTIKNNISNYASNIKNKISGFSKNKGRFIPVDASSAFAMGEWMEIAKEFNLSELSKEQRKRFYRANTDNLENIFKADSSRYGEYISNGESDKWKYIAKEILIREDKNRPFTQNEIIQIANNVVEIQNKRKVHSQMYEESKRRRLIEDTEKKTLDKIKTENPEIFERIVDYTDNLAREYITKERKKELREKAIETVERGLRSVSLEEKKKVLEELKQRKGNNSDTNTKKENEVLEKLLAESIGKSKKRNYLMQDSPRSNIGEENGKVLREGNNSNTISSADRKVEKEFDSLVKKSDIYDKLIDEEVVEVSQNEEKNISSAERVKLLQDPEYAKKVLGKDMADMLQKLLKAEKEEKEKNDKKGKDKHKNNESIYESIRRRQAEFSNMTKLDGDITKAIEDFTNTAKIHYSRQAEEINNAREEALRLKGEAIN